jgi:hypothetical protein
LVATVEEALKSSGDEDFGARPSLGEKIPSFTEVERAASCFPVKASGLPAPMVDLRGLDLCPVALYGELETLRKKTMVNILEEDSPALKWIGPLLLGGA